jgi:chromosome segregation ATPase
MAADSEFNLTLAKVSRRLDQLTRPTFDRATVEELLNEIMRLRSEPHRNQVAKELAWRDNTIDELQEQIDDLHEDHDEELLAAGRRIHELEALNTRLAEANQALAAQLGILVPKPLWRAPTEAEAVGRGADELAARLSSLSPKGVAAGVRMVNTAAKQQLIDGLRVVSNGPRQD